MPGHPLDRNSGLDPVRLRRSMQLGRQRLVTAQEVSADLSALPVPALRWVKFDVPYTLFDEPLTSCDRAIWTMPPKTAVLHAIYRSVRAFTGPSLSSASLAITNIAAADAGPSLGASTSIDVFSTPKDDYSAPQTMYHAPILAFTRQDADVDFLLTLSLAGCNCDELTGGLAEVVLLLGSFP